MNKEFQRTIIIFSLSAIISFYNACGKVSSKSSSYIGQPSLESENEGGTVVGNPIVSKGVYFSGYTTSSEGMETFGIICIDKILFLNGKKGPETQEFFVGEIQLIPTGVTIGDLHLKEGRYTHVEILIKPKCGRNETVIIDNPQGMFASHEDLELKFSGNFSVNESSKIRLEIQLLMENLASVNNYELIDEIFLSYMGDITVFE
ncbi:MAG: hypothetical protein KDD40_02015 [Bdellovibrionales bacterium]|nr:hypothetical protein [Bdellovibrionales bacterium]